LPGTNPAHEKGQCRKRGALPASGTARLIRPAMSLMGKAILGISRFRLLRGLVPLVFLSGISLQLLVQ
jgi:hypothetical protein